MKLPIMLAALGLAAVPVMAQSQDQSYGQAGRAVPPALQTTPIPAITVTGESSGMQQSAAEQSAGQQAAGAQSSGAQQESSGQLVTSAIAQSRPAGSMSAVRVQPQTQGGVTYLCGGIGIDESMYMKQTAARDYDLMMTFAARTGNYVADVEVAILDAKGNMVLQTTCDGPLMLVDLPHSGTYRVRANTRGHALDRTVQVREGRTGNMVFAWPANVVGIGTAAAGSSAGGDAGTGGSAGNQGER